MAITVEVSGNASKADTVNGNSRVLLNLAQSISITELQAQDPISIANNTTAFTLTFAGVSAAKVLGIISDVAVSLYVNGSATATPLDGVCLLMDKTSGGITSCTITNTSGSTATVSYFVGG